MQIKLRSPLDMHLHLRDKDMLEVVAPYSSENFSGAVIMPNLVPPVKTLSDVLSYRERILKASKTAKFNPFMTVFFHEDLSREDLENLKDHILSIKLYPEGITTNSKWWAKNILWEKSKQVFSDMEDLWIILNIHGETNDFVMDREKNFVPIYEHLAKDFPKLKIIMEHITTKDSADILDKYENLYATITLHHLYITLDNVAGWMLNPHLFCKPIAKRPEDREALLKLALSAHPKVMFGSDSAPHPQHAKECSHCSAWVFTSPISLQFLADLFEKHDSLDNLQAFLTENAMKIYNLEYGEQKLRSVPEKYIVLEKKDYVVPEKYWEVVPFMAWEKVSFSIV